MRSRTNSNPKDTKAIMRAIFRIVDVAKGAVVVSEVVVFVVGMFVALLYCASGSVRSVRSVGFVRSVIAVLF